MCYCFGWRSLDALIAITIVIELNVNFNIPIRLPMTETDKAIKAFITDPEIQQRLAKHIVLRCLRNSILEDFHAGKVQIPRAETIPMSLSKHLMGKYHGMISRESAMPK